MREEEIVPHLLHDPRASGNGPGSMSSGFEGRMHDSLLSDGSTALTTRSLDSQPIRYTDGCFARDDTYVLESLLRS